MVGPTEIVSSKKQDLQRQDRSSPAPYWDGTQGFLLVRQALYIRAHPWRSFTFSSTLSLFVILRIEPKASHSVGKCAWGWG